MSVVELAIEVIGWIAALLILGAYGLLTAGKLHATSPAYQWMNVVGARLHRSTAAGTARCRRRRSTSSGWRIGVAALWRIGTQRLVDLSHVIETA